MSRLEECGRIIFSPVRGRCLGCEPGDFCCLERGTGCSYDLGVPCETAWVPNGLGLGDAAGLFSVMGLISAFFRLTFHSWPPESE